MEFAIPIDTSHEYDLNFKRYVGWEESNECIKGLFEQKTINMISRKISELLMGVDPQNRKIVVSDTVIGNMLSNIYQAYRPPTGDIHSRYIVPSGINPESMVQDIINQTIETITNSVRNESEMAENNSKLTAWTTVYGDFNEHQLRQHAPIKILNKRPNPFEFHMRY